MSFKELKARVDRLEQSVFSKPRAVVATPAPAEPVKKAVVHTVLKKAAKKR